MGSIPQKDDTAAYTEQAQVEADSGTQIVEPDGGSKTVEAESPIKDDVVPAEEAA